MICLIIILSILLLFFLISLINIQIIAGYKEKFSLVLKILFIKINLSPKKKKPEKKKKSKKPKEKKEPKKKKEEVKEKNPKKKKKNPLKLLWERQGISGFVELLKDVLRLVKGVLGRFFRKLIIRDFTVRISFAGDDASDTATGYGLLCATVYPIMGQLYSRLNVVDYTVDITCNFNQGAKTEIDCSLYASIRICHIISIAVRAAARAVKTYIKMRFKK